MKVFLLQYSTMIHRRRNECEDGGAKWIYLIIIAKKAPPQFQMVGLKPPCPMGSYAYAYAMI